MEAKPLFPGHASPEVLEEYCFKRLENVQADALEQHLLLCQPCRDALDQTEAFIGLMKAGCAAPHPILARPRRPWIWKSASAAIAAGLAALLLVTVRSSPSQPVAINLVSFRGGPAATLTHAPARHRLDMAINGVDLALAAQYRVEVVTSEGEHAWDGVAILSRGRLHASLPGTLRRGLYWVRLYSNGPDPLFEYGLRLE